MASIKTKSIRDIEEKLENAEADPARRRVLESAKNFKTSWIELGQALYAVWKDKLYRNWGYYQFDAYTSKEIGIRKDTALKLLRSYYFLEKEEPQYVDRETINKADTAAVPTYESIDVLRRAKGKKDLDEADYASLRKNVLERGEDVRVIKKDLTSLMRQREEIEPEEARKKRKAALVRRFVGILKAIRNEIKASKILSAQVAKDADRLIEKIEGEIS